MQEKFIPKFNINEELESNIISVNKETQPPKYIALLKLNNYLKSPFKKEKLSEDEEYKLMLSRYRNRYCCN